jgi:hypothetical protein
MSVSFSDTARQPHGKGKFAASCLMLLLWVGSLAISFSPELHQLLHKDAKSANHECVVKQLSSGSILAGAAPVTAPLQPAVGVEISASGGSQIFSSLDYRFSPSRAPPAASQL